MGLEQMYVKIIIQYAIGSDIAATVVITHAHILELPK